MVGAIETVNEGVGNKAQKKSDGDISMHTRIE